MANEQEGYVLRECTDKGVGVFATKDFQRNEFVMPGPLLRIAKENDAWMSQVGIDKFILLGGLASKVNHSCSPNVGYRDNESGGMDHIAFRDIKTGEEIVCDYAMGNYVIQHMPKCLCGSGNCRITITGFKDLPRNVKEKYKGFSGAYLWELDSA